VQNGSCTKRKNRGISALESGVSVSSPQILQRKFLRYKQISGLDKEGLPNCSPNDICFFQTNPNRCPIHSRGIAAVSASR